MANDNYRDDEAQLALASLRDHVTRDTYEWLEEAEEKQLAWQKIQRSLQAFQQKAGQNTASTTTKPRVLEWTSSLIKPDGHGGIESTTPDDETSEPVANTTTTDNKEEMDHDNVTVKYILSDNWQGFGNQVWAASRHLANMLVDTEKCRRLLTSLLSKQQQQQTEGVARTCNEGDRHPLKDLTFCELGTGAGIPSWTAMWRGARVVSLDQAIPGRIRVLAECANRNWQDVKDLGNESSSPYHRPLVFPYDWGNPVDDIVTAVHKGGQERFDVVVAADCCFMPWFYTELLESIDMLLSDRGVAILTFSLHGNVEDEQVWGIVEMAQEKGFVAEQPVPPEQLTPQKADMKISQALVYTLTLSKRID